MTTRNLLLASIFVLAACGSDPEAPLTGSDPNAASIAEIDRFSDDFGHLFKRSSPAFDTENVRAVVPAPNEPINFDELFTVRALGPTGTRVTYYSLDILPRDPMKVWIPMRGGLPIEGQLVIIDALPGDVGYNDFVQIVEVNTDATYVANVWTSAADVMAAVAGGEATLTETNRIANYAVVPAGSIATRTFRGQTVTGNRAWMRGTVAHYLKFEENLVMTTERKVPVAEIIVMFDNNMNPSEGFETEADGSTRNVIDTLASHARYSSLWNHSVGNNENFASVVDYPSGLANVMAANVGVDVNCPEVE